jgi:hypothetical protein
MSFLKNLLNYVLFNFGFSINAQQNTGFFLENSDVLYTYGGLIPKGGQYMNYPLFYEVVFR